jgi:hypothetical protein
MELTTNSFMLVQINVKDHILSSIEGNQAKIKVKDHIFSLVEGNQAKTGKLFVSGIDSTTCEYSTTSRPMI